MNNEILNKTIHGLECCILRDPDDKPRCSECPYEGNCANRLKQDALRLVKTIKPHVMTADEIINVHEGDTIWREIRSTKKCVPLVRENGDFIGKSDFLLIEEVEYCDDYLRNYRCWNLEPTEELKNMMPWMPRFGRWLKVSGGMSPGGTPAFACAFCGKSRHLYGVEYPKRKMICDYCGTINVYPGEKNIK